MTLTATSTSTSTSTSMTSKIHPRGETVTGEAPFTPPDQIPTSGARSAWIPAFTDGTSSTTTIPMIMKPTKRNQSIKKKIAQGLASLYDEVADGPYGPTLGNVAKDAKQEGDSGNNANREIFTPPIFLQPGKASETPIKVENDPDEEDDSTTEDSSIDLNVQMDEKTSKNDGGGVLILSEWIGTSPFSVDQSTAIQVEGQLENLINYRRAIVHDLSLAPYHPSLYIDLSCLDSKLGFCDIGAANAYRALILIQAGLNVGEKIYPKSLGFKVRRSIAKRIEAHSPIIITDELERLHINAYRELLQGLLGSGAFWEGLLEAKKALELFPNDADLLESRRYLKGGFEDRHTGLKDIDVGVDQIVGLSRKGKIYEKFYPWLDKTLCYRTPALVEEANKNLGAGNCEVKQVSFGNTTTQVTEKTEDGDVGPLGVFATQDIPKGGLIMVDECLTGISNVPSSDLVHCDACHASLCVPYIHPTSVIKPSCCGKVGFCSSKCYTASQGYHKFVCGKDIDWLYQNSTGKYNRKEAKSRWRPILFLRLMCIVLSDRRSQRLAGKKPTHPLQHPLIARLTANYGQSHKKHPDISTDWQYFDNITAPHRILRLLGVDVFANPEFTPEVIQTIYWRVENNINVATNNLSHPPYHHKKSISVDADISGREKDDKNDVHMLCLNPNYIFFNHSCESNVSWHGAAPEPFVGISSLKGLDGEILQPGSSTVWCTAARDVKKGEELKISYVGNPKGDKNGERKSKREWLAKWFDGGCGCSLCVSENEREKDVEETATGTFAKQIRRLI